MGFGAVNVELGDILKGAKGIGDGIHSALQGVRELITGKAVIDPTKLAEIEATLAQVDLTQMDMQAKVNAIEAGNPSVFVSGWRPYIGWILGTAMGVYFIPMFVIGTYLWARQVITAGIWMAPPDLGIGQVIALAGSLLGLATLRTYERKNNIQRIN